MLSFLKLVKNWPKMRSGFWWFAVAPSNAASKNCNIGAQLQSLRCIKAQSCFGNFTSCMTFGVLKLVHSKLFLDYLYEAWQLLSALYNVTRKKNSYRCTSTFSALNYCGGIFFKSLSYLYEVVRTLFADFWSFCNIWPQVHENCGAI